MGAQDLRGVAGIQDLHDVGGGGRGAELGLVHLPPIYIFLARKNGKFVEC